MTTYLDWKRTDDVRDIVHVCVQALAEGHAIAIPTGTCYFSVVSGIHASAVSRLPSASGPVPTEIPPATLVVRNAVELSDFYAGDDTTAVRLARRAWPGPLQLLVPTDPHSTLTGQLPDSVRQVVCNDQGQILLSLPSHRLVRDLLRLTAGPVVMQPLVDAAGEPVTHPKQLVDPSVALVVDDGSTKFQGVSTVVRVNDNLLKIVRPGVLSADELRGLSRLVILLVCTGNTCRSPMAEALLNHKLGQQLADRLKCRPERQQSGCVDDFLPVVAISAGISAGESYASPQAIAAMASRGLDLSQHRSAMVTAKEIESADLILAMTGSHQQAIITRWPTASTICHLVGVHEDVSDPFGGPVQLYEQCAERLEQYLDRWVERIAAMKLPCWQSD